MFRLNDSSQPPKPKKEKLTSMSLAFKTLTYFCNILLFRITIKFDYEVALNVI